MTGGDLLKRVNFGPYQSVAKSNANAALMRERRQGNELFIFSIISIYQFITDEVGILSTTLYLFPNTGSSTDHASGWNSIREFQTT